MRIFLPFFVASFLFAGCGDDGGPVDGGGGADDGGAPNTDDGGVTDDDGGVSAGDGGVTADGGAVSNEPASVEVWVVPDQAVFQTGQTIVVDARVLDTDNNELTGFDVTYSTDSEQVAQQDGTTGSFTLITEGTVVIAACITVTDGQDLCDEVQLAVDAGIPDLVVETPVAGAELGADGTTMIEVRGVVETTRAVTVEVNGVSTAVDGTGTFVAMVPPTFGITHLEIVASDEVGDDSRVAMSVVWASSYVSAVDAELQPRVIFDDAGATQLGQDVFDDGQLLDVETAPIEAADLADVMRLVFTHFDHRDLIPDPVVDNPPTFLLQFPDAQTGEVEVSIAVIDGGAEFVMRYPEIEFDTAGSMNVGGSTNSLVGAVTMSGVVVRGIVDISKLDSISPFVTSMRADAQVTYETLVGDFDDVETDAIFTLEGGLLRTTIEAEMEDVVRDAYLAVVPTLMHISFTSLGSRTVGQMHETTSLNITDVGLVLDALVPSLATEPGNWIRTPMEFTMYSDVDAIHPTSRGVATSAAPEGSSLLGGQSLIFAMRGAVLNGLLHCLWNSGLLEIDATTLFAPDIGPALSEARLSGKLSPVLRPAQAPEAHDLIFGAGQLELELVVDGTLLRFGLFIEAGVDLALNDGALNLEFEPQPQVRVWPISVTAAASSVDETVVESLLRTWLLPELFDSLRSELSVSVPSFDLGDLAGITPELSGFRTEFRSPGPPQTIDNHLKFDLEFHGAYTP